MHQVQLDEGDEQPAEDASPRPRGRRRAAWVVAGSVVALVGLLLAGQSLLDARAAAHAARFDGVPGVLWPVEHLRARWHTTWGDPRTNAVRVRDVLVSGTVAPDGTVTLTGWHLLTGTTAWTTDVALPQEQRAALDRGAGADFDGSIECLASVGPGGRDARAVCVVGPHQAGQHDDEAHDTRMVVVDRTGRVTAQRTVPEAYWTVRGEHVQLATARRSGEQETFDVVEQTLDGDQVWRASVGPVRVLTDDEGMEGYQRGLASEGPWTVLNTGSTAIALDEDGRTVLEAETGPGTGARAVPGGALHVDHFGRETPGRLLLADGTPVGDPADPPYPLPLAVDDGSSSGLVLVQSAETLQALDATTGAEVWSAEQVSGWESSVVLEGVLYTRRSGGLAALDVRTGEELWRTSLTFLPWTVTTDGRSLVAAGDGSIAVLALDDGTVIDQQDAQELLPDQQGPLSLATSTLPSGVLLLQRLADFEGDHDDVWITG